MSLDRRSHLVRGGILGSATQLGQFHYLRKRHAIKISLGVAGSPNLGTQEFLGIGPIRRDTNYSFIGLSGTTSLSYYSRDLFQTQAQLIPSSKSGDS